MTLVAAVGGLPDTVVDVRMARSLAGSRGPESGRVLFTRILSLFDRVPFEPPGAV
jgi:hypothetical protein